MKTLKTILFAAAVVIVGGLGIYLGTSWRNQQDPPIAEGEIATPSSALINGMAFPNVAVIAEDSSSVETVGLVGERGAVVIFMEPGCPPCSTMTVNWQGWINEGRLTTPVLGISSASLAGIDAYKRELGLTFPVYSDTGRTFERTYAVYEFPLRVEVDATGMIRYQSYDAHEPVNAERLASLTHP
ncbi:MAG: redoxin domain-containing protein [Candidatus Zixiibacteriota bacterium]